MGAACAADAESPAGGAGYAGSLQHQADRCSAQEVLHHGGMRGGTVGGGGNHRGGG